MDLVLVDDHPAVRAGLRGLLEDDDLLRVVATAATAREGYEAIADLRPALVVADLHLPDDDGLSLCLRTRTLPQAPEVVIYTAFSDPGLAVRAVIAGAAAVVAKSTSPRRLVVHWYSRGSTRSEAAMNVRPSAAWPPRILAFAI